MKKCQRTSIFFILLAALVATTTMNGCAPEEIIVHDEIYIANASDRTVNYTWTAGSGWALPESMGGSGAVGPGTTLSIGCEDTLSDGSLCQATLTLTLGSGTPGQIYSAVVTNYREAGFAESMGELRVDGLPMNRTIITVTQAMVDAAH